MNADLRERMRRALACKRCRGLAIQYAQDCAACSDLVFDVIRDWMVEQMEKQGFHQQAYVVQEMFRIRRERDEDPKGPTL
jgi:hypothetical protein